MGADDLKENKDKLDSQSLAEELLAGGAIESIDWSKTDTRGFTVLHCLLSISCCIFYFLLLLCTNHEFPIHLHFDFLT
jgi:hypothetical protein